METGRYEEGLEFVKHGLQVRWGLGYNGRELCFNTVIGSSRGYQSDSHGKSNHQQDQ